MPELYNRSFSFNLPFGQCRRCIGIGTRLTVDPDLLVPDESLPVAEAIAPWHGSEGARQRRQAQDRVTGAGHDPATPWRDLPTTLRADLLTGADGVVAWLDLVRAADWVLEIGPDGGTAGGELIAAGTPDVLARQAAGPTGRFLAAAS